mmetsp:Transcript_15468/g.42561  ORF Transcript_15468/g.42561 Transcript_15468/m.42561 type:complete len:113 (+) Transcript_15468:89-427(+)
MTPGQTDERHRALTVQSPLQGSSGISQSAQDEGCLNETESLLCQGTPKNVATTTQKEEEARDTSKDRGAPAMRDESGSLLRAIYRRPGWQRQMQRPLDDALAGPSNIAGPSR